jgi:hypothetical protein
LGGAPYVVFLLCFCAVLLCLALKISAGRHRRYPGAVPPARPAPSLCGKNTRFASRCAPGPPTAAAAATPGRRARRACWGAATRSGAARGALRALCRHALAAAPPRHSPRARRTVRHGSWSVALQRRPDLKGSASFQWPPLAVGRTPADPWGIYSAFGGDDYLFKLFVSRCAPPPSSALAHRLLT